MDDERCQNGCCYNEEISIHDETATPGRIARGSSRYKHHRKSKKLPEQTQSPDNLAINIPKEFTQEELIALAYYIENLRRKSAEEQLTISMRSVEVLATDNNSPTDGNQQVVESAANRNVKKMLSSESTSVVFNVSVEENPPPEYECPECIRTDNIEQLEMPKKKDSCAATLSRICRMTIYTVILIILCFICYLNISVFMFVFVSILVVALVNQGVREDEAQ